MRGTIGEPQRRRAAQVGAAALSLVALLAAPAGAQQGGTGSGAGTGTETAFTTGTDFGPGPTCLEVTDSSYEIDVVGSFTAVDGTTAVSYTGPATITYSTTETYYVGPQGSYDGLTSAPLNCDPQRFGPAGTVSTEVSVSSPGSDGIDCPLSTTGEYFRVNTTISLTWTGSCTVKMGTMTPSTPVGTQHTFVGNFLPCPPPLPPLLLDACDEVDNVVTGFRSTYEDNHVQGSWTYGGASP